MRLSLIVFILLFLIGKTEAQVDSSMVGKMVVVTTNGGGKHTGTLLSDDGREIQIMSVDKGKIIIPKYVIESIRPLHENKSSKKDDYIEGNQYYSHYQFSPTAIPTEKTEIQLRMPYFAAGIVDIGVTEEFSLSFGTAWFAAYSLSGSWKKKLSGSGHVGITAGLGGLVARFGRNSRYGEASGTWGRVYYTVGNPERNFTVGGGYATTFAGSEGSIVLNAGGMARLNKRLSLLAEGITFPRYKFGSIGWSMRILTKKMNAWDLGLQFVVYEETYTTILPTGQTTTQRGLSGIGFPYVGYLHKF